MYGKMKNAVSALRTKAAYVSAAAFVAACGILTGTASAEGVTLEIPDTNLDWSNMSDSIMSAISEPLGIGIGCGLAIWLVLLAVRVLKKPVKG